MMAADFFAGRHGWGKALAAAGFQVRAVDPFAMACAKKDGES
jgi:hypothetical protein